MVLAMRMLGACAVAVLLAGCGGGGGDSPLSAPAALGQAAFNDPSLSASGRLSCASCHAAEAGHSAPNALAVQLGGADGLTQGLRASQSVRYLTANGSFHFDEEGTPTGGFFWDGRAATLAMLLRKSATAGSSMSAPNGAAPMQRALRE